MKKLLFILYMLLSFGSFGQSISEVIYPRFIQGVGSGLSSDDRKTPYACRMTVSGLTAFTTYRYYNQLVDDPLLINNEQGNYILANASGNFTRVTSPSLSLAGSYGEFTTDASGIYTGWFVNEATSVSEFLPGTTLHFRLLINNGAGGGSVANRVTATNAVTVINFGSTTADGTGLRSTAVASYAPKNFIMLFDNLAGSGRPVSGTFIESDGTDNSVVNGYAPFYANSVNGVANTWGSIIPNNLSNGINKIAQYSLSTGAVVNFCTSANGVYGATSTANASSGLSELVVSCAPATCPAYTVTVTAPGIPCAGGTTTVTVSATGGTAPYTGTGVFTNVSPGAYTYTVTDAVGCVRVATYIVNQVVTASSNAGTIACGQTTTSVTVSASQGVAPYTGTGIFTVPAGPYSFTVTDANGCTATTSGVVEAPVCITLSEVQYPRYVQGVGSSSASDDRKVPYAARMTVGGLTAFTTYRYFPRFVSDPALNTNGQGNFMIANATGNFTRVTSPSLSLAGRYGEFTTDASGNYTGWFVIEPSLAIEFQPGTQLYFRLMLNNGAGGGSVANRVTATNAVTVINFGSTPSDGTGLRSTAVASYAPKNFIMLFDNLAGSGRPVSGTFIESDGTDNSVVNGYAPFYANSVNGVANTWGSIIPNNLSNGINKIAQYSLSTGAVVNFCTSASGVYGATNTANASSGLSELVVSCAPATCPAYTVTVTAPGIPCAGGTTTVTVSATGGTAPYTGTGVFTNVSPGAYTYTVTDAVGCVRVATYIVNQVVTASSNAGTIACGQTTTSVTVSASQGVAPYTGTGIFTVPAGPYSFTVTDANGCTATTSGVVEAPVCITLSEVQYPRYVQGVGSSSASDDRKVPYAARMTVGGLTAFTTYRYFPRFVSDPALNTNGQGNFMIANATGNFTRVTSPSLSLAGRYGEFTTDASGNYTGWFVIEPSLAIEFQPGTQLYFRLMLNNGAGGGSVANRVTATNAVTVINFGSTPSDGTGLRSTAVASYAPKNFIMLFDNLAGSGRPVSGTFIESDGTDNSVVNGYAPFYANSVNGVANTWGSIIPNNLSNGINNVSQFALSNGALINSCTSANGVYGATNTANANGGLTELVMGCIPTGATTITLNLKAYIEGFYDATAGLMKPTLFDLGISTIADETDTITVNLWSISNLSNATPDYTRKVVIHTDGTATALFPSAISGGSFYIAIRHRSTMETWSKSTIEMSSVTSYDFSTGLLQAYDDGINPPMADMGGVFALYGGDVNQDFTIDGSDANDVEINTDLFAFGYDATDANGDGATDGQDANIVEINTNKFLFYARPF